MCRITSYFFNFSLLVEYQFCTNSKHEIAADTVRKEVLSIQIHSVKDTDIENRWSAN